MKTSTIVLAAGAAFALFVMQQRAANARTIAGVSTKTTADYFTPTQLAESLARLIVGVTQNVRTEEPAGIFAVKAPPIPAGGSADSGTLGWDKYDNTGTGDPYGSWLSTTFETSATKVASASGLTSSVDLIAAAPVYSPGDDFLLNPFYVNGGVT